ncbi:helix-turn-helix domain-containing protein [Providencia huaxiensis]|nr:MULTISPECIES: helix-turn-helix transcriptional regulator [Providencia]HCI96902.1 XRE family transcriptional regulator [Providencia sp.]ELR5056730.1 helix-turn-helix transcriptional regulator [Providencia rettgeri]ELR5086103.1 helix-turn-helix transcriptional regulator [Providencia rettgeri]MDH2322168.1 helix-turn-helix transcriptional regulator [Providencia rettgeri]WOB89822.1 helix-turn-helix transcriptional regulator [Providencia sp. PROV175]
MNFEENRTNSQCDNHDNQISTYFGAIIKQIRRECGMTGAELAKKLNVSQQQMSRYERGINKISVDMLFNLSIALNVPFEKLIKKVLLEIEKSNSDDALMLKKLIAASDTVYFY